MTSLALWQLKRRIVNYKLIKNTLSKTISDISSTDPLL